MKGGGLLLKELNQVIDFIEDHLAEDLSLESISEFAGVSDYHFRMVFFYLSRMTLNEYIRNRKLSEANKDLLNGEKVTDVAFKYGYQSIDGFTRAFKKWSGFLLSETIKKRLGFVPASLAMEYNALENVMQKSFYLFVYSLVATNLLI